MKIKVGEIRGLVKTVLSEMGLPAVSMEEPGVAEVGPIASLAEKLGGQVLSTGASGKTGRISCELDGSPVEITVVVR